MNFDFVSWGEEGVEADDELGVTPKEAGDPSDDAGCVNALALELLHDVKKVVVHLRLVAELVLDL